MDPNSTDAQELLAPPQLQPKNKSRLPITFGILCIILLSIGTLSLLQVNKVKPQTTSQKGDIATSPTLTPPVSLSLLKKADYNAFSIVFADSTGNIFTNCKDRKEGISNRTNVKLFDNIKQETIYLAVEKDTYLQPVNKEKINLTDDRVCEEKTTTVDFLKNGYGPGYQPDVIEYPTRIEYKYKSISSDKDLVSLWQSMFSNNCTTVSKKTIAGKNGIYSITPHDASGGNDFLDGKGCMTNFGYDFYYSEKDKVAILGNHAQECIWDRVENIPNSVGNGCGAVIVFQSTSSIAN